MNEKRREYLKQYRIENSESKREYNRNYRIKNAEKIRQYKKQHNVENAKKNREYRIENAEKIREYNRRYNIENSEKRRELNRNYRIENAVIVKNSMIKTMYGITFEEEKQMYVSQNGMCAICGDKFKHRKDIHIDHNHTTGKIRQLLCKKCNFGIGFLRDDVSIVLKAAEYLNKWNKQ